MTNLVIRVLVEVTLITQQERHFRQASLSAQSSAWQVACILPFMRLGELIIRAPKLDAAPVAIKDMIFSDPGAALKGIGHALIGWLLAAPIIIVVLAQILKPILAWAAQRYTAVVASVIMGNAVQALQLPERHASCSICGLV